MAKYPQKGPLKDSRPLDFFGIEGQNFGMILENKVVQKSILSKILLKKVDLQINNH